MHYNWVDDDPEKNQRIHLRKAGDTQIRCLLLPENKRPNSVGIRIALSDWSSTVHISVTQFKAEQ